MRTTTVLLCLALTISTVATTTTSKKGTTEVSYKLRKPLAFPVSRMDGSNRRRRCLPRGSSCRPRRGRRCCSRAICRRIRIRTRRGRRTVFRCVRRRPRPPSPSPSSSASPSASPSVSPFPSPSVSPSASPSVSPSPSPSVSPQIFDDNEADTECRNFWTSSDSPPSTLAELTTLTSSCAFPAQFMFNRIEVSAPVCTQTCPDTGLKRTVIAVLGFQVNGSSLSDADCLASIIRPIWSTFPFVDCNDRDDLEFSTSLAIVPNTQAIVDAGISCGFTQTQIVGAFYFLATEPSNIEIC